MNASVLREQEEAVMSTLYETDFYQWTQEQAKALRAKQLYALDFEHLAEEIEDLGRNVEHAIESHLERLLHHLLKWRDDPAEEPRRSWQLTIVHARREIAKYLRRNPGLQHLPERYLAEAYRYARQDASIETGLSLATFPETCPWTIAQVLDMEFLPEVQQ
jgi:hypothetical protein